MDLGLQGKTVLITGGSKGIGLACADVFAAEGCAVHIAARPGRAVVDELGHGVGRWGESTVVDSAGDLKVVLFSMVTGRIAGDRASSQVAAQFTA